MIALSHSPVSCMVSRRFSAALKGIVLPGLLAAMAGCGAPRLTLIPEVSPPLVQEEVLAWTGPAAGNVLFSCAAGVGWVDPSGQVRAWDPGKKAAGEPFRLPFAVSGTPFCQNGFLALKSQAAGQLLVFDLARMETRFVAGNLPVSRILGVDGRHLVFLDGENLVVCDWQNPAGIFRRATGGEELFNCHFFPERVLIMGRGHVFVFWRHSRKFQQLPLPLPAAGPSVCRGEALYYGSSQRQLVKYSLPDKKLAWKLTLGHDVERQPLLQAGTIVVSPADNNVLQLGAGGSVRWWLALNSILQYDLVPMTDHLAAFLLSREIKFINFRSRQVTVFKIHGRPAGMPLAARNDLYFIVTDGAMQKLQRVGNRYGLDVTLSPGQAQWLGVPCTVSFQTSNLLKPRIQCLVRDEAGKTVLTKRFTRADRGQVVWLPGRAGVYRVQVSAAALNRNEEKEFSFQVCDPRLIIPLLYLF